MAAGNQVSNLVQIGPFLLPGLQSGEANPPRASFTQDDDHAMLHTTRRRFLRSAAGSALGLVAANRLTAAAAAQPSPPTAWTKHGVVLEPAKDAPAERIQCFTCPAEPLGEGRWRLWHSTYGPGVPKTIGYAEGVPGEPIQRRMAVLSPGEPADAPLAIGNLPEGWRPTQVVHVPLGGGRHRIYFWAHGPGVVRYLAAESDDGRRYRVLDPLRPCLYHPHDRAVDGGAAAKAGLKRLAGRISKRPDGEPPAPPELISNDATNVYRLSGGDFEMYSVALVEVDRDDPAYVAHDNAAGWVRVIDRYTSDDGLRWTNRRRVIERDAQDPSDQQFYYLAVTHTPEGRFGMLGHYRVEAQTMDLEWCFSSDGIRWERPQRSGWISRGAPGEPDCYGIYPSQSLVYAEGRWHLFYTGVNYAHNGKHSHGKPAAVIMLATCDKLSAAG